MNKAPTKIGILSKHYRPQKIEHRDPYNFLPFTEKTIFGFDAITVFVAVVAVFCVVIARVFA